MSFDFSPEVRNSAWWSGDSRKAANGKANEVILTKLGHLEIPDLSGIEAVRMGHVMEPVILQLAADKLGTEVRKIEHGMAHPKELWLKCHFDGVTSQNELVEAKNYNASVRNKFDAETGRMPAADMAQCIHEACVFGTDVVYLAVLFGGQEFVMIKVEVTDQMKEDFIKQMSVYWSHIVSQTPLPPENVEQARLLYPTSEKAVKTASSALEDACLQLKAIKERIKTLEEQEDTLQTAIMSNMGPADTLVDVAGQALITWKTAAGQKRFDSKLFQSTMPDIYSKFMYEAPGSRRFLVK